ncbi:MAG: hypothetical protein IH862_05000 [Chloroflexi bacterium]|nr:hypothetical protein [Chloroflexota bacterium]
MANDRTAPSSDAEAGSCSPGQGDGPPADGPPAHLRLAESDHDSTPLLSDLEASTGGLEGSLLLKRPADDEPAERSAGKGRNVGTQALAARIDALEKRLAANKALQSGTVDSLPRTPEAPAPQHGDGEVERLRFHIATLSAKLIHTQQQLENLKNSRVRRRRDKRPSPKRSWWRRLVPG